MCFSVSRDTTQTASIAFMHSPDVTSAGTSDGQFIVPSGPLISELLTLPSGSGGQSLTLDITDDLVALENVESFNLTLSSPSDLRAQLGALSVADIFIEDDDGELLFI